MKNELGNQLRNTRLLTTHEASMILRVSDRTIWTLTNDGRLPCVRVGKRVFYDMRDVENFIEESKSK